MGGFAWFGCLSFTICTACRLASLIVSGMYLCEYQNVVDLAISAAASRREANMHWKHQAFTIMLMFLLVAVIWMYSEEALVIIAGMYGVVGLVLHIVRFLRHRVVARTA